MFQCLKENWNGKDYVFRKELEKFTGGVITHCTFAHLTSKGWKDLPQSFVIGHKAAYKIDDIIMWLEKHTEKLAG